LEKNPLKIFVSFLYGLIFGFGSPIPGVSAGTMAILLNVYDSFFSSISVEMAKKNILRIFSFLIGWLVGLLGVSRIMVFLFENHGLLISYTFMGLVLGCIPAIYKKARADKVRPRNFSFFGIALVFMFFLAFYGEGFLADSTLEELGGLTPGLLVRVFLASFVSSMSMLIPGVGGSLMMIAFGIYTIYIESVATLNIVLLTVFLVSMVLGVGAGIYLTKIALEKFSQGLYFAIMGFILGSLLFIFPGTAFDLTGIISKGSAVVGFVFAYWLSTRGPDEGKASD